MLPLISRFAFVQATFKRKKMSSYLNSEWKWISHLSWKCWQKCKSNVRVWQTQSALSLCRLDSMNFFIASLLTAKPVQLTRVTYCTLWDSCWFFSSLVSNTMLPLISRFTFVQATFTGENCSEWKWIISYLLIVSTEVQMFSILNVSFTFCWVSCIWRTQSAWVCVGSILWTFSSPRYWQPSRHSWRRWDSGTWRG